MFAAVPLLHRFGELVAPLTFILSASAVIMFICWDVGTGSGVQFYFVTNASLVVLQLGIDRNRLAMLLASLSAGLLIAVEFLAPHTTRLEPRWALSTSFVIAAVSACLMVVVTIWFALRDTARAEAVIEGE